MNLIPSPEEVTTTTAAEILLDHGWTIYPYALPYGEFFYVPASGDRYDFQVASLAYRYLWQRYQDMPLLARIPPQINTRRT